MKIKKTKKLSPVTQQLHEPGFLFHKFISILFLFFILYSELYSQNPNLQFAFNVGGATARGQSVALDQQGNVYTTGFFYGTTDFDPGPGTANLIATGNSGNTFFAKYSSTGVYQWAFNLPGGYGAGNSIFVDAPGNIYLMGRFSGATDFDPGAGTANLVSNGSTDIFVAKYDPSGIYQWAFNIGGTSQDEGHSVKVDAAGNVYVTGYFAGMADFDPGPGVTNLSPVGIFDIFVAKYNAAGNYQWAFNIGTPSFPSAGYAMALDASSNVYLTGTFYYTADFDPGPGVANLNASANDIFLAKYNSAGVYQWAFNVGGPSSDDGYSITTDIAGNVYLGGFFQGIVDFDPGAGSNYLVGPGAFLSKYDPAGNFKWAFPIRNTGAGGTINIIHSISTDNSGDVFITGHFSNTADFDPGPGVASLSGSVEPDIFVAKYNASGAYQWAFSAGNIHDDVGSSIAVDNWGNIFVTGYFWDVADFDPNAGVTNLSAHNGFSDLFLAKYSPCALLAAAGNIAGNGLVCAGSTNTYSISPVAGAVSYTWTLPNGWTGTSTSNSINCIAGNNGGVISVTVNGNCGPATSSQPLNITVNPVITPDAVITASPSGPVCPGTTVIFTATAANMGSAVISNYDFKVNGVTQQSGPSNTYTTSSLNHADVVSCVIDLIGGTCLASSTIVSNSIVTTLNSVPTISFDPANPTIIAGNSVRLHARVTENIASYLWTPPTGLDDPSIPAPLARPAITTTYKLKVISTAGCIAEKTMQVKVFNEIYIPNSFAPGGNILNRVFKIPPGTSLNLAYLIVYDRYGNEVFATSDINQGWDGTCKGARSPQGTYVYIIKGADHRGPVFLKGTVMLIR